jgi:hypothetical protein
VGQAAGKQGRGGIFILPGAGMCRPAGIPAYGRSALAKIDRHLYVNICYFQQDSSAAKKAIYNPKNPCEANKIKDQRDS